MEHLTTGTETIKGENMTTTTRVTVAMDLLQAGYSCSEALVLAYADDLQLDSSLALKLASGFAGGMGDRYGTCGVMTAACLVIGLVAGPDEISNPASRNRVRGLVAAFREGFAADHGALACGDLNGGFDPASQEGKVAIRAGGRVQRLVARAVQRLDALLDRP
ncbi:C-GCAxxG-C-C family protein [Desulfoluna spongiiphila]|uniref:C_GCAxxG_C_C family probable redox protein n=1 Tax=Desulfoluna spongiiphila TaxID=419481 RepID=A0A1G5CZG4_9BACT|nr:C-GCAxxG-C-C family protein [Desulfoluna spongiiphila]SCY07835.1 C_GCAxxG_C_C family probable redox protein [Desulfoluna spongiiphila]